ncbi:MAG TPA: cytochrome c [Stellaceae bacterium]|nr:cytochrome c [Stellaceae bacterium]
MNRMIFLAAALAVLGSATLAQAQPSASGAETPTDKGEYLARAGDCVACHTVPGGKAFAGGLKMGTPLGAIYSTNITPDPETGIGQYSFEDFERAVRRGVAKDGHRLYPAMPYPSYAKITDDDMHALYTFFMKEVPPVKEPNKPSEIRGVLSWRWPLAIWNVLFTKSGAYTPNPDHDAAWNRGAYLVEGLGHCGACHTPRGWAFQEKALDASSGAYLQGAELDAWSAPNLRGDVRTGLGSWSQEELATFLKDGHNMKGVAFGSMLDVVNNSTPYLTDEDVSAMAAYLKSLPATAQQAAYVYDDATTKSLQSGKPQEAGAAIYLGSCVSCHGIDGKGQTPFMPPLAGNPVVLDNNPSSLINLVLNGAEPLIVKGTPDSYRMPQYRVQLTDAEIASVLSFVRSAWGNGASPVTSDRVKTLRPITDPSSDRVLILKMR